MASGRKRQRRLVGLALAVLLITGAMACSSKNEQAGTGPNIWGLTATRLVVELVPLEVDLPVGVSSIVGHTFWDGSEPVWVTYGDKSGFTPGGGPLYFFSGLTGEELGTVGNKVVKAILDQGRLYWLERPGPEQSRLLAAYPGPGIDGVGLIGWPAEIIDFDVHGSWLVVTTLDKTIIYQQTGGAAVEKHRLGRGGAVALADLDNSGDLELVLRDAMGADFYVYRLQDNAWELLWNTASEGGERFDGLILAEDLTGDGVMEIYAGDMSGRMAQLVLTADGLAEKKVKHPGQEGTFRVFNYYHHKALVLWCWWDSEEGAVYTIKSNE
jgi:hypothetical protein